MFYLSKKNVLKILYIAPPIAVFFANSPLVEKYDLSSLKKINSAAAPLSVSVQQLAVQRLREAGIKDPRISQVFGITELSKYSHFHVRGRAVPRIFTCFYRSGSD